MEEKLNEYNIHFEVVGLESISSISLMNNIARDLPVMIIDSIKRHVKPCNCGGKTKIDILVKEQDYKVKSSYCCINFERLASKFVPR